MFCKWYTLNSLTIAIPSTKPPALDGFSKVSLCIMVPHRQANQDCHLHIMAKWRFNFSTQARKSVLKARGIRHQTPYQCIINYQTFRLLYITCRTTNCKNRFSFHINCIIRHAVKQDTIMYIFFLSIGESVMIVNFDNNYSFHFLVFSICFT